MDVGQFLRATRERHGVSQSQLARRAGTSQAFVSKVERGDVSPTADTLERLLQSMGEQLVLDARRMPGWLDDDPDQRRMSRALTAEERVRNGAKTTRLGAKLRAGRR